MMAPLYNFETTPGGFPLIRMDDADRPFATFLTVVAMEDPTELQTIIKCLETSLTGTPCSERIEAEDCHLEIDGARYVVRATRFNPFMHRTQTAEMALDHFRELVVAWREFLIRQETGKQTETPTPGATAVVA